MSTSSILSRKHMKQDFTSEYKVKNGFLKEISTNWIPYLMAVPGILYFLLFCYIPMSGIVIAFKNYNMQDGIYGSPWVGFKNFEFFFGSSSTVLQTTFNTLFLNTLFISVGLVFQIGMAVMISEIGNKYLKKLAQSLIFLPYFLSWVVIGAIVYSFLSNQVGLVNSVLKSLGFEAISWYTEPKYWRSILVIVNIWKFTGYGSVIYLATIVGIDPSYYEAAIVDGASKFKQLQYITLPLLKPTAVILILLAIGRIFYGDFGMIYGIVKDNGILLDKVEVIDTYVYRAMRTTGDFSFSAAIGIFQSLVGLVFVTAMNQLAKKVNDGDGLF